MDSESNNILLELNLSTLYLRQQRAFAQFVDSNKQGTESSGLMSYFVSDSRLGRSVQDVIFSYHSVSRAAAVCFQILFLGSVGNCLIECSCQNGVTDLRQLKLLRFRPQPLHLGALEGNRFDVHKFHKILTSHPSTRLRSRIPAFLSLRF